MALMTCPDCANQYPDDAPYCPNCGRPNPARQTGAAGAAPGAGQPETPAGAGPTSPPSTAGTGSPGDAGSTGQAGYTGGTGNTAGAAGGGYSGATGGAYAGDVPPTGGAGGGGYTGGGYPGGGGYTGGGGAEFAGGVPPQQIPNYMVQSILVTLLTCFACCIPIGAVALFFSTQVNSKRDAGDIQGALAASKNAKLWCWITFGVAVVTMVLWMVFGVLGAIMGAVAEQANQGG